MPPSQGVATIKDVEAFRLSVALRSRLLLLSSTVGLGGPVGVVLLAQRRIAKVAVTKAKAPLEPRVVAQPMVENTFRRGGGMRPLLCVWLRANPGGWIDVTDQIRLRAPVGVVAVAVR